MKKLRSIYKRELLHPMLYKAVGRLAVAAVLCLLWQRFVSDGYLSLWEGPVLVCGAVFLGWAWLNYLALDGMTLRHLTGRDHVQQEKPKRFHSTRSIVDYADEKILAYEDLEPDEKRLCNLLVNLVLGLAMVAVGLVAGAL